MRGARLAHGEMLLQVCTVAGSRLQIPDAYDAPVACHWWAKAFGAHMLLDLEHVVVMLLQRDLLAILHKLGLQAKSLELLREGGLGVLLNNFSLSRR